MLCLIFRHSRQKIALREYFTLGGCAGPGRPNTHIRAERASHNNSLREYFTLGGCAGPGRLIHTYEQREQATITSFDTRDMKPMQSMCKLLYAVFDLSTLTT